MASVQNQAPNVDLFDAYFRRADLDRDGRISGAEAVAFFQGSGLSKQVLAQVIPFCSSLPLHFHRDSIGFCAFFFSTTTVLDSCVLVPGRMNLLSII